MHEGHRKRMIEKLLDGKNILSDHELLEILLFYSIPRKNVNETAHLLLDNFGTLDGVMHANADALMTVEGVGSSTAAFFEVISEIQNRINANSKELPEIISYNNCRQYLIDSFRGLNEEKFIALFLNAQGKVIHRAILSSHSDKMVEIDVSKLTAIAGSRKAKRAIIAHNHLSNSCKPSNADDLATEKICAAFYVSGTVLADHIIVAGNESFSYNASGRLKLIEDRIATLFSKQ